MIANIFPKRHSPYTPDLLRQYSNLLLQRGVEGFITIDLNLPHSLPLPTVAVAGHLGYGRVTNIVLDRHRAAGLALQHLVKLGHRNIAIMKGHPLSSDCETRWQNICAVAQDYGVPIRPELTIQVDTEESSPELGYSVTRRLVAAGHPFTALFAYNDLAAIGAIRVIHEGGKRVPQDVSVVGFDDIDAAAFHNPSLTTIRRLFIRWERLPLKLCLRQSNALRFAAGAAAH